MPRFRFETIESDRTKIFEEELASADLAGLRAVEEAHEALVATTEGADHSRSFTKVYDEAGYLVASVNFSDVKLPAEQSSRATPSVNLDPPIEEPGVKRSG